ncbi:MAG: hypothetical protein Q7V56_05460 [Gammaproteobacteria bacterium]|nr:hypothetical protein [Gammaproteobacteria bacterium]
MLLRVELAPSRLLFAGIAISYLLALASLVFADIPPWASCVLALGISFSVLSSQFRRTQPVALLISEDMIRLYFPDRQISVLLETECHCTPWVQILHFRECLQERALTNPTFTNSTLTEPDSLPVSMPRLGTTRYRVILLPDSCRKSMRRKLAVLLRWHRFAHATQLV